MSVSEGTAQASLQKDAVADAHVAVIRNGRRRLLESLRPLVSQASSIALLDFPAHPNVGDSAIWLGALRALRDAGAPAPVYTCDQGTYDRGKLARVIGNGTICFTGGGSFGDLWEHHLLFRERVVADFPRNPIVQLPESVHFQWEESLARSRAVFNAHDQVTILVRDAVSLAFVQREFRATTALTCDLAFGLGAIDRPTVPTKDVVWLKRADKEDRFGSARVPDAVDWMDEHRTVLIRATDALRKGAQSAPWWSDVARTAIRFAYPQLAATRLARGSALLSAGRVVVTDRLHGHILSLLLGIPHVVLDNSYGKLHQFVAAWTESSPLVHTAQTPDEAANIATTLLNAPHV